MAARIAEEMVLDIKQQIDEYLARHLVTRKELMSFAGKTNHVAGLLFTLRPFLQQLYGALNTTTTKSKKQI